MAIAVKTPTISTASGGCGRSMGGFAFSRSESKPRKWWTRKLRERGRRRPSPATHQTSWRTPCAPGRNLWFGCSRCPECRKRPRWPASTSLGLSRAMESRPRDARPDNKKVREAASPRRWPDPRRLPFSDTRLPWGNRFSCSTPCPFPGPDLWRRDRGLREFAIPRLPRRAALVASAFAPAQTHQRVRRKTLATAAWTATREGRTAARILTRKIPIRKLPGTQVEIRKRIASLSWRVAYRRLEHSRRQRRSSDQCDFI